MANEPATKAPSKTKASKGERLVIVFEGDDQKLLDKVKAAAKADRRDPDTVVILALEKHFNPTQPA